MQRHSLQFNVHQARLASSNSPFACNGALAMLRRVDVAEPSSTTGAWPSRAAARKRHLMAVNLEGATYLTASSCDGRENRSDRCHDNSRQAGTFPARASRRSTRGAPRPRLEPKNRSLSQARGALPLHWRRGTVQHIDGGLEQHFERRTALSPRPVLMSPTAHPKKEACHCSGAASLPQAGRRLGAYTGVSTHMGRQRGQRRCAFCSSSACDRSPSASRQWRRCASELAP